MTVIPFPNFAPDRPALESGIVPFISNVRPKNEQGYGPLRTLATTGDALTARCQGARSFRGTDGTIETFAGDATKLYRWTGSTWADVSKVGGYLTPDEGRWTFEQFGTYVYAANGVDSMQVWTLGSSSAFADAAGAPVARYLATVRDFLFAAHLAADTQASQWSAQFDSTAWTGNQADSQSFPNLGRLTGIVGGQYPVLFQEHGITLGTYVGPDNIFQFDNISLETGCIVPGSIAHVEQTVVFIGKDGFYRIDGGQAIRNIGDGVVDDYFWDNVDLDNLHRVWAAFDVRKKDYYITFPTSTATMGTNNRTLIYNLTRDRWGQMESTGFDVLFQMFSDLSIDLDTDIDVADQDLDGAGLPSLDSEIFFGSNVPKLAAFSSDKLVGFFAGDTMEALIDTEEAQLASGRRAFVSMVRPIVDGGTLAVALGTRDRPNDTMTVGSYVAQNNSGECLFRSAARQHKARLKIAAGSTWSNAQGIDVRAARDGDR